MEFQFRQWKGQLMAGLYANTYNKTNQIALQLVNDDPVSPLIATVTVAIPRPIKPGWIAVKDYSENKGMLQALLTQGIVTGPIKIHQQGFVEIQIVELTKQAKEAFKKQLEAKYESINFDYLTE